RVKLRLVFPIGHLVSHYQGFLRCPRNRGKLNGWSLPERRGGPDVGRKSPRGISRSPREGRSGPTRGRSGPTPGPSGPTPGPSGPTPAPTGPTPAPTGPTLELWGHPAQCGGRPFSPGSFSPVLTTNRPDFTSFGSNRERRRYT